MSTNSSRLLNIGIVVICFLLFVGFIGVVYYNVTERAKHVHLEKSETRTFELIAVRPPKHFYVDIKDIETGETYRSVPVSKHCNSWRETAMVGRYYQILVETYYDDRDNSRRVKYKNLEQTFCR